MCPHAGVCLCTCKWRTAIDVRGPWSLSTYLLHAYDVYVCMCYGTHVEPEDSFWSHFSPSTFTWVLGLKVPGPASTWALAGTLTAELSCQPYFIFWDKVWLNLNLARLMDQQAPEVPLPPLPQCWDYRYTLPHWLLHGSWGPELKSSCLCGKHFPDGAISPAPSYCL